MTQPSRITSMMIKLYMVHIILLYGEDFFTGPPTISEHDFGSLELKTRKGKDVCANFMSDSINAALELNKTEPCGEPVGVRTIFEDMLQGDKV